MERAALTCPKMPFGEWMERLKGLAIPKYYDSIDPDDWRGFYRDWYTPYEALQEDQDDS